jgi:HSP20 family molecular chaperone IbpA
MNARLPVHKKDSIFDEIEKMERQIERRAYELFEGRGCEVGRDMDDWLAAERELVWSPPISVEESDGEITIRLSAPGFEPEQIDVELTPQDLLVEAAAHEQREKGKGKTRAKKLRTTRLFRSVHLPRAIDPDTAEAELSNGVLRLTAKVATEERSGARAA